MSKPIEEVMKEVGLSDVRESSGSSVSSKGSTDRESRPIEHSCTSCILSVDPIERSWKKLLNDENLRPSRLWAHAELNLEGTPCPKLKNLVTYAWVRHCFELFWRTWFLTPISEVERKFASDSVSSMKPKIMDDDAAIARRHERALATAAKKCKQSTNHHDVAEMLKSSQPTTPAPASPQVTHAVKDSSKPKEARLEELERQVAELSTNDDRLQMKYKAECNTP
ncbi:hypothetical protein ACOSP7_026609 [Xanthoceras sorbifolium]